MPRSSRTAQGFAAASILAIVAVAAVAVAGCTPATAGLAPSVDAPTPIAVGPVPTPVPYAPSALPATAVPQPSAPASPLVASTPEPDGVDGDVIPLDVFRDDDVRLAISDPEGLIEQASSGQAADGMSAAWADAIVRNAGPRTLEVVWTGIPRDEVVTLVARSDGERILLRFGQEAAPESYDLMGADRIVLLTFAAPVDAGDVATDFTTLD